MRYAINVSNGLKARIKTSNSVRSMAMASWMFRARTLCSGRSIRSKMVKYCFKGDIFASLLSKGLWVYIFCFRSA